MGLGKATGLPQGTGIQLSPGRVSLVKVEWVCVADKTLQMEGAAREGQGQDRPWYGGGISRFVPGAWTRRQSRARILGSSQEQMETPRV